MEENHHKHREQPWNLDEITLYYLNVFIVWWKSTMSSICGFIQMYNGCGHFNLLESLERERLFGAYQKEEGEKYCGRELLLMVSFVVQNHVSIQSTQCMLCLKLSPVIKGLQWQRGTHPWRQALCPYCHLGICLFHYDPRPAWLVYLTILTWYCIKGMNPTLTPYRDLHWMIGPMYLKAIRHENHDEHSLRTETRPSRN